MKDGTELPGAKSANIPDSTFTISLMEGSAKIMLYNEITQNGGAIVTAVGEETRRLERLTVRSVITKGMPGNSILKLLAPPDIKSKVGVYGCVDYKLHL